MKHFLAYILLLFCGLVTVTPGLSQVDKPSVKLQGRATKGSIKLRWAPDSPVAWRFANQYGYTVERITISINNQVLQQPIRTVLSRAPLKPARQELWENFMDQDDYVAIAAQAIFGESFDVTQNHSSEVVKVINKARELESRFSFALFSADQSIKAAELSGLYYEDETIAPATKYLYRVYANVPSTILSLDTGFVYLGLQDYTPLPKLRDVRAEFDDRAALISWNGGLMDRIYNSFWVERSDDDAKTFTKITERPVVNTFSGDKPNTKMVFKIDTLPANNKVYYYRVIGITAFGDTGPPSDTVSGSGKPPFAYSAAIESHAISKEGKVELHWAFPLEGEPLLQSFDLFRVNQQTKVFDAVKKNIDRTVRFFEDETPRSTNYYVLQARDKYGRSNNSFPYLVQLEDSIPPSSPVELTGRIDTAGHVFLNWKANAEEDLFGYQLFKSNFRSDEFNLVPGPILKANSYVDTIKLNNLTEKIYYSVVALDRRYNPSTFAEILTLEKPDLIPPVPPVFRAIKNDSLGIRLSWYRSGSEDVAEHLLYRKAETESEWTLIKSISVADTSQTYLDQSTEHHISYSYTLLAVDDDKLESPPAEPVSMRWLNSNPYPEIEKIFFTVDKTKKSITLSWNYDQGDIEKFLIYRANNGEPLKLYKSIDATIREINDYYKLSDNNVEYRIVASFKTGERTKISKSVVIKM